MTPLDPATPRGQRAERELNAVLAGVLVRQERDRRAATPTPTNRQERSA